MESGFGHRKFRGAASSVGSGASREKALGFGDVIRCDHFCRLWNVDSMSAAGLRNNRADANEK
jgi:hypothetical protein